jgi:cell division transport system permease protein
MIRHEEPHYRRRIATAQVTMVISITLVLFLLGLMGLIVLHAGLLSDYVRENIGFSIMIKEEIKESKIIDLKKSLDIKPYVKSSEYVPREKAAQKLKADLGEDFVDFLGYNPLLSSIELRIKAAYANHDSLARIETRLMANPEIKEIFYQKSLVDAINQNVEKISLILLGFSSILLFIAIVLINNTIRLSVYSKRFIIRSMQLVGATEAFIRKPMVRRSILHGFLSAFFAQLMLMAVVYFALEEIPELVELTNPLMLIILVVSMFLLGAMISFFSTWFAVKKYLRIRTDLLYT